MEFVLDRNTLLAINRRAAEMLRDMDGRNDVITRPRTFPAGASDSRSMPAHPDLWPSPATQFSVEDIRKGFRIANEKLNSIYANDARIPGTRRVETDKST